MKALSIAVVVVVLMALAGWITFSASGDRAAVTLETQEIREDAETAAEKGKELLEQAGDQTREALRDRDAAEP